MKDLIKHIIKAKVTKVTEERFNNILNFKESVDSLDGDIVECGVWKGGMSLFLTKLFPEKQIWIADSFSGFGENTNNLYNYTGKTYRKGQMAASKKEVIANFDKFDIAMSNVNILEGYVKDTLPNSGIEHIALLRVDVDAYSSTLEVLNSLYDKVVEGGLVIFDDTCLKETRDALRYFFKKRNIKLEIYDPSTDKPVDLRKENLPCGCYMIKNI